MIMISKRFTNQQSLIMTGYDYSEDMKQLTLYLRHGNADIIFGGTNPGILAMFDKAEKLNTLDDLFSYLNSFLTDRMIIKK